MRLSICTSKVFNGGNALKFYASVCWNIRRTGLITKKEKRKNVDKNDILHYKTSECVTLGIRFMFLVWKHSGDVLSYMAARNQARMSVLGIERPTRVALMLLQELKAQILSMIQGQV
ncbi:uncharacterized protein LOC141597263 [Silene latifolia]|uniref:uncharacterized protein LOC141597263 n=1 Tax=Silene latifolia TaxID=37657 RepID=UPI003D76DA92